MPLTILTDWQIKTLLLSLRRPEIELLQSNLAEALHEYSNGTQESHAGSSHNQPQRTTLAARNDGAVSTTTLVMPARSGHTTGVKIVTLATPGAERRNTATEENEKGEENAATKNKLADGTSSLSLASISSSVSSLSTKSASRTSSHSPVITPSIASHIISPTPKSLIPSARSSSSMSKASSKIQRPESPSIALLPSIASTIVLPPSAAKATSSPHGSLTILDTIGSPLGFLGAAELTAFRTALAATLLFTKRTCVKRIAIFGAGRLAFWHIRLALLLRGSDVRHIDIVNRTFASAEPLLTEIYQSAEWATLRKGDGHAVCFSVLGHEYGEYNRLLKELVRGADAIFMCTPATTPWFPAEYLTSSEGRRKGRYVSLAGSYAPHMIELHADVLRQACAPSESSHHHHYHRHAERGGVVVVDSLEACLHEAGEVIQAGLGARQLVELGELIMVKKAAMAEVAVSGEGAAGLKRWLEAGNVIYKSVGLGIMDLCVGEDVVHLARERGVGVMVDF